MILYCAVSLIVGMAIGWLIALYPDFVVTVRGDDDGWPVVSWRGKVYYLATKDEVEIK